MKLFHITLNGILQKLTRKMALSRGWSCGRPRKFADGFISADKGMYMTDKTSLRWRKLRA